MDSGESTPLIFSTVRLPRLGLSEQSDQHGSLEDWGAGIPDSRLVTARTRVPACPLSVPLVPWAAVEAASPRVHFSL